MSPPTLYQICVKVTNDFLRRGVWRSCEKNPFSSLPSDIVQTLLDSLLRLCLPSRLPVPWYPRFHADHFHLLLTSGLIKQINLFDCPQPLALILLQKLSFGCQNLQALTLSHMGGSDDASRALGTLLQRAPRLEELHTAIYFDPHNLKSCKQLRTLRLHFADEHEMVEKFCLRLSPEHLKGLQRLEMFSFCYSGPLCRHYQKDDVLIKLAAMVLDNCPNVTSLGHLESSFAMKQILGGPTTELSVSRSFQLRQCFWGIMFSHEINSNEWSLLPDVIRCVVLSFPLVELLVMNVCNADCLHYLSGLKNLVSLEIDFRSCDNDFRPKFYSLLNEIGAQLKHFAISNNKNLPLNLNVICDKCPNLESLDLSCSMTVEKPVKPGVNPLQLAHLSIRTRSCNNECLIFLLSNSVHLKTLFLYHSRSLEDGNLKTILQKNSFSELEVSCIEDCSVSMLFLRKFIQSARSLKFFIFSSSLLYRNCVKESIAELNPNVVYYNDSQLLNSETSRKLFIPFRYRSCVV